MANTRASIVVISLKGKLIYNKRIKTPLHKIKEIDIIKKTQNGNRYF